MNEKIAIPDSLRKQVLDIGSDVRAEDVDTYGKIREIEDKSHKLRTVLDAWGKQQDDERSLRGSYAKKVIIAMILQLCCVDLVVVALGIGWLSVPKTVTNTFIISVFGEVAAMALIVTKYLFPEVGTEALKLIEKL